MSASSRRIWVLAAVFFAATAVVVLHLAFLTLWQHEQWRVRSYQNRWAFRDVPTRRGSLLDREGNVIARDQPGFELLGNYRQFRRRHAVGAAVHGANLLSRAADWVPDYFGYRDHPGDPLRAFDLLMGLPLTSLTSDRHGDKEDGAALARDLRFYATAVLSACTGRERRYVRLDLANALEERAPIRVWQAVVTDYDDLRDSFRGRWDELLRLEAVLVAAGPETGSATGLIDILEGWRHQHEERLVEQLEWRQEDWYQPIQDELPFELAAWIRSGQGRHPGLQLTPSVRRIYEPLPGRADSGSLAALVGNVAVLDRADMARDVDQRVTGAIGQFRFRDSLVGESEGVLDSAAESAQAALRRYFETSGRTGLLGVESALDASLAGAPGLRWAERNKQAREQFLLSALDVAPGRDVRLTLDVQLQSALEAVVASKFDGQGELALAMIDADAGDILAVGGLPLRVTGKADDGTDQVFLRRWPPGLGALGSPDVGSVAKPFVLLEHLTARRRGQPNTALFIPCPGKSRYSGVLLGCVKVHGAVTASPEAALAQSCNQFFFQVAAGIGLEGVHRAFERVGWNPGPDADADGIYQRDIPGIKGRALPVVRPERRLLEQQSIGYGVNVSALYVARAYAALATGSLPRLRMVDDGEPAAAIGLDVHPADLDTVRNGLRAAVVSGTAAEVQWLPGLEVYGKTGTAEITRAGHNNAWFAGYFTTPNGRRLAFAAVAYLVPDETHGGGIAAELVAEMLRRMDSNEALQKRYLRGEGRP